MSTKSYALCWTLNNYIPGEIEATRDLLRTAEYGVIGYEIAPTTGTPHLQCYGHWGSQRTAYSVTRAVKRASRIQFCKGTAKQNQLYCTKEGNFEEFGEISFQGQRTDIELFRDAIFGGMSEFDLIMTYPGMMARYIKFYYLCRSHYLERKFMEEKIVPELHVIVGEPGIGKTKYVYDNFRYDEIYKAEFSDGSKNAIFWDNYRGQDVILLDDFKENLPLNYLIRLTDRYPQQLQFKGGTTWRVASKIFITTNIHPDDWYHNYLDVQRKALFRRIASITCLGLSPPIKPTLENIIEEFKNLQE